MDELKRKLIELGIILAGILVSSLIATIKSYFRKKLTERQLNIIEKVADNTILAIDQINKESNLHGKEKYKAAEEIFIKHLRKWGIPMLEEEAKIYIESALKKNNDNLVY